MAGYDDKADHYIGLLDTARANVNWNELPELIRKVKKHAPNRKLLLQTATSEYEIASQGKNNAASSVVSKNLDELESCVKEDGDTLSEEVLQAKACLAWAAWVGTVSRKELLEPLPEDQIRSIFDRFGQKEIDIWTRICLIKAAYIQGSAILQDGRQDNAFSVFDPAMAWMEINSQIISATPQLFYWAEQLLARRAVTSASETPTSAETLKAFRLWSGFANAGQDKSPNVYGNLVSAHIVRFEVWQEYYIVLSKALQTPESPSIAPVSRLKQTRELRTVESAYETELLRTQKFPKATESNVLIEEWVEQAIQNWYVLCGSDWRDTDLGAGGRNAVTRNMLDILYRAASKTFQSTQILRRLFQVHKSLAEFDLAYRCLDTYVELIERGRIRSMKSHEPDPKQDSDEIVLLTIADGIQGLCSFGQQEEARKAYGLSKKLEKWLWQLLPVISADRTRNIPADIEHTIDTRLSKPLSPETTETIHRSMGIAKANWARWTPFSESRPELQSSALLDLQNACETPDPQLESMYALTLLLAETREIDSAIQYAKQAIQSSSGRKLQTRSLVLERKLLPFWHLLALLLSSRQDFDVASRSCTAAFEQFSTSDILASRDRNTSKTSSVEKDIAAEVGTLVDEMECDELQRMIELQISHVALTELLDGSELALRGSNDLLSLYSRLFARLDMNLDAKHQQKHLEPPKSSAGTVKSFRGSIFSRKKAATSSVAPSSTNAADNSPHLTTSNATRPLTQASPAPAIQVTDETENRNTEKHKIFRHSHDGGSLKPKKHVPKKLVRNHSKSRESTASARESTVNESNTVVNKSVDRTSVPNTGNGATVNGKISEDSNMAEKHDNDPLSKQPVGEIPHQLASHNKVPPPSGHTKQPPEQDVRLPTVHSRTSATAPVPRFPKTAAQKHALMLLSKIWLVVATLYRRGHMFEDAREACDEASKAAAKIEVLVSSSNPSARALSDPGWGGGGKSSDEVWADVYCEKAELNLAIAHRREEEGQDVSTDNLNEAVDLLEQCLMYFPNHPSGIICLSNLLLDYYEKKIELGRRVDDGRIHKHFNLPHRPQLLRSDSFPEAVNGPMTPAHDPLQPPAHLSTDEDLRKTPENLNRIAARDRAYGLLSTLTKLGSAWDNSEAWYALARAHELGGEVERAKNILWWCIELEDTRPIRHWRNLGCSGYVL